MLSKKYANPHVDTIRRNLWNFLLWKMGYYDGSTPPKAPPGYRYPFLPSQYNAIHPSATWVNHSTYLIQVQGSHFLTDPIWAKRCSPLPFIGPKRHHPPGLPFTDLPPIDCVLISHDHYDHLDRATVEKLRRAFPNILWIVPRGLFTWFVQQNISRVMELDWWEEIEINSSFRITSVPAQHFSGRFRMNKTLWCGYVVEALSIGKRFYFAGDTGYNTQDFKQIGAKWKFFDLALIPIGTYCPRKFMSAVHVDPREAVKIHQEIGSKLSLGMHWKTFSLSDEALEQPPFDLYKALQEAKIPPQHFLALEPGTKVNW